MNIQAASVISVSAGGTTGFVRRVSSTINRRRQRMRKPEYQRYSLCKGKRVMYWSQKFTNKPIRKITTTFTIH